MTEEYNFFKDFAGVTKEDLQYFQKGGMPKINPELLKKNKDIFKKPSQPKDTLTSPKSQPNIPRTSVKKKKQDPRAGKKYHDDNNGYGTVRPSRKKNDLKDI